MTTAKPPDPRAAREQRRREIDAVLVGATEAELAGVMAAEEATAHPGCLYPREAERILVILQTRCGGWHPFGTEAAIAAHDRATPPRRDDMDRRDDNDDFGEWGQR